MKIEGEARRGRVYIGEDDRRHGEPPFFAIVGGGREGGVAGGTRLRGLERYGADNRLHTPRLPRLSQALPIVIDIVARAERIDMLLPILDEMVDEGLITLENVHVVKYVHGGAGSSPAGSPGAEPG